MSVSKNSYTFRAVACPEWATFFLQQMLLICVYNMEINFHQKIIVNFPFIENLKTQLQNNAEFDENELA